MSERSTIMNDSAVLVAAIHDLGSAKAVARIARCSQPTAQRYRSGITMPDPIRLARLMAASRAVTDAMLAMAGLDDLALSLREAELDREIQALRDKRAARHGFATSETARHPRNRVDDDRSRR